MAKMAQQRAAAGQLAAARERITELEAEIAGLQRKNAELQAAATRPSRATQPSRQRSSERIGQ